MPTEGSASIIFTVFESEPQTPIPSPSLGTSSNAHRRLWMITIIFCLNQDVQDLRINRMFDNGWVDEFLGMFDICFSMILLIT
jgi:hypothetical protein